MPNDGSKGALLRRGSLWAKGRDVAYYMLWFEYLKISPSYELARKKRAGIWTAAEEARKPADFDDVLAIYDDLGDVRSLLFDQWWLETAIAFFGYQGEKPRVTRVGALRHDTQDNAEKLVANARTYVDSAWRKQGGQATVVLAIPVGLPKAQIAKQVAAFVAKFPEAHRNLTSNPPKYKLVRRKLDSSSLFKYLMCVWVKAKFPKMALWRIGVHAKVSTTYSGRLEPDGKLSPHQQTEDRNALKILTSRAITRGIMIAENAARGIFPSYAKNDHVTSPDWEEMRLTLKRRLDLEKSR